MKNDGIYAIVNGVEYRLRFIDEGDGSPRCNMCDMHGSDGCKASSLCRAAENAFINCYWKRTEPVAVMNDGNTCLYAYCYNCDADWSGTPQPSASVVYSTKDWDDGSFMTITADFDNSTYHRTIWNEQ